MKDKWFLKEIYYGSDRDDDFKKEFIEYLKDIADNIGSAMNDETSNFLAGGKRAIYEIIEEIKSLMPRTDEEEQV